MRLMMLLMAFSFLLAGCNGVDRPNTDLCTINVPALHEKCYNMKNDYDDSGKRKTGVKPHFIQYKDAAAMLVGLNKKTSIDPVSWANLKAYVNDLRNEN